MVAAKVQRRLVQDVVPGSKVPAQLELTYGRCKVTFRPGLFESPEIARIEAALSKRPARTLKLSEPSPKKTFYSPTSTLTAKWLDDKAAVLGPHLTSLPFAIWRMMWDRGLFIEHVAAGLGMAIGTVHAAANEIRYWNTLDIDAGKRRVPVTVSETHYHSRYHSAPRSYETQVIPPESAKLIRWIQAQPVKAQNDDLNENNQNRWCVVRVGQRVNGASVGIPCMFYWRRNVDGWQEHARSMLMPLNDYFERME